MTRSERQHNEALVSIGCICCRNEGVYSMPEVHHVRRLATSKKRKLAPKLPLCPPHHRTGGYGVAIHDGRQEWEKNYGQEMKLLAQVETILSGYLKQCEAEKKE